jgi:hypothetical protein
MVIHDQDTASAYSAVMRALRGDSEISFKEESSDVIHDSRSVWDPNTCRTSSASLLPMFRPLASRGAPYRYPSRSSTVLLA